jgi:hypothetical protein
MAEVPELSDRIRRLHALRWKGLVEKYGFNGEHLTWHESPARRRQAARPRFSLAAPPLTRIDDRTSNRMIFYGADGQPVPYEKWREQQMAAWKARESDPAVIDSIGISETITLANERFATVVGDYVSFWASEAEGDSDVFARWADALGMSVGREVADLWEKDEWHTAWFGRACREKVAQGLEPLKKQWKERAAALEIQHLENPHLSMHSLLAAEGDVKIAYTLDHGKQALESARGTISRRQANLANISTNQSITVDPEPKTNDSKLGSGPLGAGDSLNAFFAAEIAPSKTQIEDRTPERTRQQENLTGPASNGDGLIRNYLGEGLNTGGINDAKARRRGFEADTERHNTIAAIVGRHDAHWRNGSRAWCRHSTLKEICIDLDQAEIEVPESWRTGKTPSLKGVKLKGWCDAVELGYKKHVVDQVRYSLKMTMNKTRLKFREN